IEAATAADDPGPGADDVLDPESGHPTAGATACFVLALVQSERGAAAQREAAPVRRVHLESEADDIAVEGDLLVHIYDVDHQRVEANGHLNPPIWRGVQR